MNGPFFRCGTPSTVFNQAIQDALARQPVVHHVLPGVPEISGPPGRMIDDPAFIQKTLDRAALAFDLFGGVKVPPGSMTALRRLFR